MSVRKYTYQQPPYNAEGLGRCESARTVITNFKDHKRSEAPTRTPNESTMMEVQPSRWQSVRSGIP